MKHELRIRAGVEKKSKEEEAIQTLLKKIVFLKRENAKIKDDLKNYDDIMHNDDTTLKTEFE